MYSESAGAPSATSLSVGKSLFFDYMKRRSPTISKEDTDAKWCSVQAQKAMKKFWNELHKELQSKHSACVGGAAPSASGSPSSSSSSSSALVNVGGELDKIKVLSKEEMQSYAAIIGRKIVESNEAVAKMLAAVAAM